MRLFRFIASLGVAFFFSFSPNDANAACVRGGCSGQLCVNEKDASNAITTCEWSPAYDCYARFGRCEQSPNGQCEWQLTKELRRCLQTPHADGQADELRESADALLDVREINGVRYVSGGVGDEEQAALKAMENDYNLKVLMTADKGAFVSSAMIHIVNATGETVLETESEGPIMLVRLLPGLYGVNAKGAAPQQVRVGSNGRAVAYLRW